MNGMTDQATVAKPSIFNLHSDILLFIFHLNTVVPETEYWNHTAYVSSDPPRPLTIALHTSQVCHVWRQTIFGSPAIWGSLVDMTIFGISKKSWVDEVLQRTRDADLSIYGCVGDRVEPLLMSVLEKHWHRVRKLDILFHTQVTDAMWAIFTARPAPILEKFLLRVNDIKFLDAITAKGKSAETMFANFAPSLRRHHCPLFEHNLHRQNWASQLLSLTLSHPLTTTDILKILGTTVLLESLVIMEPVSTRQAVDWKKIVLPKLVRLHIAGTVCQSLLFLQTIIGHPDCALILHIDDNGEDVSPTQFDSFFKIIAAYTTQYMDVYQPRRLIIYEGILLFELQIVSNTDKTYFAYPEIHLKFQYGLSSYRRMRQSRESIRLAISSIPLGSIVELDFNCRETIYSSPEPPEGLLNLIKSLSSVHTLVISPYFNLLNSLNPNNAEVLPLLKLIHLKARNPTWEKDFMEEKILVQTMFIFLSERNVAGVPVLKVVFGDGAMESTGEYDWSFLENIEGLKVIWRRGSEEFEYICGSGEKDALKWH